MPEWGRNAAMSMSRLSCGPRGTVTIRHYSAGNQQCLVDFTQNVLSSVFFCAPDMKIRDIVVAAGAAFSEGNLISFLCSAFYLRLLGNIIPKPLCTGVTPSLSY